MFDELRDLYQEVILQHGRHPRHGARLAAFDVTARGDNPMCGDRIQVWVRYRDDNTIDATGFEARGCTISVASADLMAETVAGMAAPEVKDAFGAFRTLVTTGDCPDCTAIERLRPLAGVHEYPSRVKCATLPWHALIAALNGAKESSSE